MICTYELESLDNENPHFLPPGIYCSRGIAAFYFVTPLPLQREPITLCLTPEPFSVSFAQLEGSGQPAHEPVEWPDGVTRTRVCRVKLLPPQAPSPAPDPLNQAVADYLRENPLPPPESLPQPPPEAATPTSKELSAMQYAGAEMAFARARARWLRSLEVTVQGTCTPCLPPGQQFSVYFHPTEGQRLIRGEPQPVFGYLARPLAGWAGLLRGSRVQVQVQGPLRFSALAEKQSGVEYVLAPFMRAAMEELDNEGTK